MSIAQVLSTMLLVRDDVFDASAALEVEEHVKGADFVTLNSE